MKAIILGSGGPIPDGKRCAPSHVVICSVGPILLDCGSGAGFRLAQAKIPFKDIQYIFLSHLHMDHCIEFPSIVFSAFLTGRKQPVHVFGPKGLAHLGEVFFDDIFSYLKIIVKTVTGNDLSVIYHEISPERIDLSKELSIHAGLVKHGNIEAYGYRIEESGKSITYSGDTEPCDSVMALSRGVDLLIHDCAFPDSVRTSPGHTLPFQLRLIVSETKPKQVVLTHLFPACNGHEEEMKKSVETGFKGKVSVAEDLMEFDV